MIVSGVILIAGIYFYLKGDLPDVTTLQDVRLQTPMQVLTADGELISQFGEKRRIPLKLQEMPPLLVQAFLAVEDTRFYEHPGIDIIGIFRAATVVASSGDFSQGASTITQQLARNFFLSREKKIIRKIKEIFLAFHIEQLLTKDQILELYLNKIELGQRAFGVGAAAQVYFGKTVHELTVDEIAIIAGLPKAPSALNPVRSATNARGRRNVVLGRMLDTGVIDKASYDEAIAAPVISRLHGAQITASAPYIAEMVRQEMVGRFGEETAYSNGFKVYTTINSAQQAAAKQALQQNLYQYDERHGYRGPVAELWQSTLVEDDIAGLTFDQHDPLSREQIVAYIDQQTAIEDLTPAVVISVAQQTVTALIPGNQEVTIDWDGLKWARIFRTDERQWPAPKTAFAIVKPGQHVLLRQQAGQWQLSQVPLASSAIVAIDPHNGAIRSLVGGYSFSQSQFNRVTQAKRQVGSNIKPFIYSAALEHDHTLATIMNDAPIHQWDNNAGIAWRPKNSPAVYDGPIRIREALAKSKNVVSVRLLRAVGIDNTIAHLRRFGFASSDLPRNETLSLGSASLTPLELVTGYAVFANGGYLLTPFVIDKVLSQDDSIVFQHQPAIACGNCNANQFQATAEELELLSTVDTEAQLDQLFNTLASDSNKQQDAETIAKPELSLAEQVISEQNSFLIADAMKSSIWGGGSWQHDTGWNGTAWRLQSLKRRDLSAKTGTTNDFKDTWLSGFTPDLAVTVWVGFDDANRSLGRALWNANLGQQQSAGAESGARTALPAWQYYMQQVLPSYPEQAKSPPAGLASVRIDTETGLLSRRNDHSSIFEYFKPGTEPKQYVSETVQQIIFDDAGSESNDNKQDEEIELF